MSRFRDRRGLSVAILGLSLLTGGAAPVFADGFGLGRTALPEEIAAWDIDVRPDGQGLPEGSGTVAEGEVIFNERCAVCHGDFGEGIDRWPVLTGGEDTLASEDPVKTIGSYWPYASTVFDYVHRAMPFGDAQSLTSNETYAVVAYLLNLNYILDDDATLSRENFTEIVMPNVEGFIDDARPDTVAAGEPCMTNCKTDVQIVARARVLDVTPIDDTPHGKAEAPVEGLDLALVAEGEKVWRKCKACHQIGEGASDKVGPMLTGIVGAQIGRSAGFKYSKVLQEKGTAGAVWDPAALDAFLAKPRDFAAGTKMSFAGLTKSDERAAIIEYLKSMAE